ETRPVQFDARVVAVDGTPVSGAAEVRAAVERAAPGTRLRYTVRRSGTGDLDVMIPTTTFTTGDYVELFVPLLLGGLVGIALGLVPVLARPDLTTTRLFFLGQLGLEVKFGFLASDAYLVHHLPRWGFLAVGLAIGSFLHLAMIMPEVRRPMRTHPQATLAVIYGAALVQTVLLGLRSPIAVIGLGSLIAVG